jgi:hypothetical protein
MNRLFARWSALAFATAALAVSTTVLPPAAQAQALTCVNTPTAGGGFTLTCTPSLTCTITAAPSANVTPGNPITLTANCTPAASANATYLWSLLSGAPNCQASGFGSGATTTPLTASAVTSPACNYQVVITDGGKGGLPTLAVSWTTTPPAPPTGCSLSLATTPSPLTTAAFTATPTVSGCTPAGSLTYSWTKNGLIWSGANTANPTDSEAANTGTPALNYTYTPTVCNGPSQGTNCVTLSGVTASQPGTGGGGGGGTQYSCHTINPSVISGSTTTINETWATPGVNVAAPMGVHDAIVVVFTTGANPNGSASFSRVTGAEWNGSAASTRVAVLSTQPCDFGTGVGGPYAVSTNSTFTMYFNVGQASPYNFPTLKPNTQYFVNIRNAANPSCASNGNCEMFVSLLKGAGL